MKSNSKIAALSFSMISLAIATLSGYTISSKDSNILNNQMIRIFPEGYVLFTNKLVSVESLGWLLGGILVIFTTISLITISISLFRRSGYVPMFTIIITALPIIPSFLLIIYYSVYFRSLESAHPNIPYGEYLVLISLLVSQIFYVYAIVKQQKHPSD